MHHSLYTGESQVRHCNLSKKVSLQTFFCFLVSSLTLLYLLFFGLIDTSDMYIDDANPRVQYSTGWGTAGAAKESNGTAHWTEQDGATATLVFTGTGVAVYGTIASKKETTDGGPSITLFSVDGDGPARYYATPISGKVQYNVQFFSSQLLQNGQHTIVITKFQNSSRFFLDYFVVSSPSPSQSTDVSSTPRLVTTTIIKTTSPGLKTKPLATTFPNPSSNHISSSRLDVTNTSLAAVPTASSATTHTGFSIPIRAIVGTLLGSFVFIAAVVIFILWLRRRLRHEITIVPFTANNKMNQVP